LVQAAEPTVPAMVVTMLLEEETSFENLQQAKF
jgi:hypothetical protein